MTHTRWPWRFVLLATTLLLVTVGPPVADANGHLIVADQQAFRGGVSDERVTISATDNTATEAGRTTARFTLTRTGSTALPLTVRYTVGGTAIGGKDYVALPGHRTIPAGSATATIISGRSTIASWSAPRRSSYNWRPVPTGSASPAMRP